jgi:C-terminal region of band_7
VHSFGNIAKVGNTVVVPANLADMSGLIAAAMGVVKAGK